MLGIEKEEQISRDPLVGNIFENLVVIDCLKERLNKGQEPNLYFFRDSNGNEVDLLFENQRKLVPIEIKSSSTFNSKFLKGLNKFQGLSPKASSGYLIYSGDLAFESDKHSVLNFRALGAIF